MYTFCLWFTGRPVSTGRPVTHCPPDVRHLPEIRSILYRAKLSVVRYSPDVRSILYRVKLSVVRYSPDVRSFPDCLASSGSNRRAKPTSGIVRKSGTPHPEPNCRISGTYRMSGAFQTPDVRQVPDVRQTDVLPKLHYIHPLACYSCRMSGDSPDVRCLFCHRTSGNYRTSDNFTAKVAPTATFPLGL